MQYVSTILDWLSYNYMVLIGFVILLALYLKDIYDHGGFCKTGDPGCLSYSYDAKKGPHVWKELYPGARGDRQSPVNIISYCAINIPIETSTPLTYSTCYHLPPSDMTLFNNGHNVVIYANWHNGKRPTVNGGPLKEPYTFSNILFRWGPNDDEGSEHMVDAKRFAMEMQLTFIKNSTKDHGENSQVDAKCLTIISYFFMVTPMDNPYMEQVIACLCHIRSPHTSIAIDPIPLTLLAPCFSRKYLTYVGSLTYPPCTEGARWIIQPEALTISSRQVRKFRKLTGINGQIFNNCRPVQQLNNRDVFIYD